MDKDVIFEEDLPTPLDEDDELNEITKGPPTIRYYASEKVLGKLYREIDEHNFFKEIQKQSRMPSTIPGQTHSLADAVWNYVRDQTALIQWEHYKPWARDVKEK